MYGRRMGDVVCGHHGIPIAASIDTGRDQTRKIPKKGLQTADRLRVEEFHVVLNFAEELRAEMGGG